LSGTAATASLTREMETFWAIVAIAVFFTTFVVVPAVALLALARTAGTRNR